MNADESLSMHAKKYLFFFGGFPDIRHLGGGIVSPHSEGNPATFELVRKYDVNISASFSGTPPKNAIHLRITDSSTSVVAGGITFKCLSERFFCSGTNQKIFGVDVSYPFHISDFVVGAGAFIRTSWGTPIISQTPTNFFGMGAMITRSWQEFGIVGGGVFVSDDRFELGGGVGIGAFTEYLFGFAQLFYLDKPIFSAGATVMVLNWFRVSLGYTEKLIVGGGFVSPRLYVWAGWSFLNFTFVNIGIIL